MNTNSQWGPDFIGMYILDAQQIWDMYETGTMSLPCFETTYQTMKIFCNQEPYPYEYNIVQTREMNQNRTITVEREGVASPQIAVPPPQ
ncbi:MAG: hypothetical protein ACRD2P_16880 [Terriglobia bacterium]